MIVNSFLSIADNHSFVASFDYFYCANLDFDKTRCSSDDVMRFIFSQLAVDTKGPRKIKDFLCSEYERQIVKTYGDGLDLPKLRTQDCARLILELAEQDSLIIIVDAIDIIKKNERHALISALKKMVMKTNNVIKIFITSRISNRTTIAPTTDKQIQIISHETQQDMKIFVNHLIETAVTSKLLFERKVFSVLRNMLIQTLFNEAEEM